MDKFEADHETNEISQHRHLKNIFAGSTSSTISRFFGQPLDVLKIRFQLQQLHSMHTAVKGTQMVYRSIPHALKLIYIEEGTRGLWRGHNVSQFQGFFQGITQFWVFAQITEYLRATPSGASYPNVANFTSGFITGTIIVLMLNPIDMLRTRLMARSKILHSKTTTFMSAFDEIYSKQGISGFYTGCTSSIVHVSSLLGAKFLFYDLFCELSMTLLNKDQRVQLPNTVLLLAGAGAGLFSNIFTYPLDLVKRRLQMDSIDGYQNRTCSHMIQCTRAIAINQGFLSLYKGFFPCVIKSAVSTSIQFSAFDKLYHWINDYL